MTHQTVIVNKESLAELSERARQMRASETRLTGEVKNQISNLVMSIDQGRKRAAAALAGIAREVQGLDPLTQTQRIQIVSKGSVTSDEPALVETQVIGDIWASDIRFNCRSKVLTSSKESKESTLVAFEYGEGGAISPHYHHEEELTTVVSGTFVDEVNGITLCAGDSVLYPPNTVHAVKTEGGGVIIVKWSPPMETSPSGGVVVRRVHVVTQTLSLTRETGKAS